MRYLLILLIFSGCYTQRTALKQVARAHNTYPHIPAKFCADTYDPTDSVSVVTEYIQGDDVIVMDTVINDHYSIDSLIITRYITKTITKVDTVVKYKYVQTENKAALVVKDAEIARLSQELATTTHSRQTWRNWAIYMGIAWLLAIVVIVVRLWFKSKAKVVGI